MNDLIGQAYRLVRYPNRIDRIRRRTRENRARANEVLLERELKDFALTLRSRPTVLYLDTTTACNLKCPFCPTGNGDAELVQGNLTRDTFSKIVANLRVDFIQHVNFFNWGEPLLNPHLTEYIHYFSCRGKSTAISTNFSVKEHDDKFLERLVESGIGEVYVSVDGASEETYERYRIRGDFRRVLRNMKALNAAKIRLGSDSPIVYYKMLLNKFNESEIELAKQYAKDCGAEFLLHEHFWVPPDLRDEWVADSLKEKYGDLPVSSYQMRRGETIHTECRQLWDSVLVSSNGDVYPCCLVSKASRKVGNLTEKHIDEILNGPKMRELRAYVTDPNAPDPAFENHCVGCTNRYCTHDVAVEA